MKKTVIYGSGMLASLASFQLRKLLNKNVAGFTVDEAYLDKSEFEDLPVVGFNGVENIFPVESHNIILPIGYRSMNALRRDRLNQAKQKGYEIGKFVSPHVCFISDIDIDENVLIFEQAIIQPHVKLGINTIIRSGANIGHHSVVGDHSFIASGVVTGGNVAIGDQCFVGLGAIIRDNIRIADRCFIGAGAVVIKDTDTDGVYIGNPARKIDKTSLEVSR